MPAPFSGCAALRHVRLGADGVEVEGAVLADAGDAGRRTAEEEPVSGEPAAAEYAAKDDSDVPVIEIEEEEEKTVEECPLSSAINDLFEQIPPVDKMADKVNSTLDEMGDNLRRFSSDLGKQISDMADDLMGKKDKKD